jgi:hypothetical protein
MILSFQACDYVRNANQPIKVGAVQPNTRKILIEDYTGHACGNCPKAARQLTALEGLYGSQIIPVAVHAGFYSAVTPSSNPPYPTDLTSTAGTDWDNTFGNSASGNPNGLVNRVDHDSASLFIKQWPDWGTAAGKFYNTLADFKITISNTFNTGSSQLTTSIITKAINAKVGTFNLTVILTEDSIIGEQEDYAITPSYITNYVFNHVLRGSLNGSWGTQIFTGSISKNDSIVKTYNYTLPSNYKYKHCHVIAFIYNADAASPSYYEVLQAESKDIN